MFLQDSKRQTFEAQKEICECKEKKERHLVFNSLIIYINNISTNESHILWNTVSVDLKCIL